jgi:hypothetical protein
MNETRRSHASRRFLGAVFVPGFMWFAGTASICVFSFANDFSSLARAFNSFAYFTRAADGASSWETVFSSFGLLCLCFIVFFFEQAFSVQPRSLAMACVCCKRKAMARSLAKRRADHAQRRLRQLRTILPELPKDVLEQCNLRQLSFAMRRCGGPCQLSLHSVGQPADDSASPASLPSLLCSPPPCLLGER